MAVALQTDSAVLAATKDLSLHLDLDCAVSNAMKTPSSSSAVRLGPLESLLFVVFAFLPFDDDFSILDARSSVVLVPVFPLPG